MRIASIAIGTLIGAGTLAFGGTALADTAPGAAPGTAPAPSGPAASAAPSASPTRPAPSARPVPSGPSAPLVGDVSPARVRAGEAVGVGVTGCRTARGPVTATSAAFTAPAELTGTASAPRPRLGGSATVRRDARPGGYPVVIHCGARTARVLLTVTGAASPATRTGQTKVVPKGPAKTGDGTMAALAGEPSGVRYAAGAAGLALAAGGGAAAVALAGRRRRTRA